MKSRRQNGSAAAGEGTAHSGHNNMERKDVEKNRRLHMKGLCLKLSSLVPPSAAAKHAALRSAPASSSNPNKDTVTQLDHLDNAAAYIKHLTERIEELRQRKGSSSRHALSAPAAAAGDVRMPVIEVRCQDGALEAVLVSAAERPFRMHEVVAVLEQEGAEVVSASFSVVGDKVFYTVHSQALISAGVEGLDVARVADRLRGLLLVEY